METQPSLPPVNEQLATIVNDAVTAAMKPVFESLPKGFIAQPNKKTDSATGNEEQPA